MVNFLIKIQSLYYIIIPKHHHSKVFYIFPPFLQLKYPFKFNYPIEVNNEISITKGQYGIPKPKQFLIKIE